MNNRSFLCTKMYNRRAKSILIGVHIIYDFQVKKTNQISWHVVFFSDMWDRKHKITIISECIQINKQLEKFIFSGIKKFSRSQYPSYWLSLL